MSQNRGYYVFIHEDNSPVEPCPEASSLEWDEETFKDTFPQTEDDTWASLYTWYAQMLEQSDETVSTSQSAVFKSMIDRVDVKQRGAAHYAAEHGHAGVLRLLLETNCNLDSADGDGLTPLHIAVKCGQINAAEILLKVTSNPNRYTLDSKHHTALHIAALGGHVRIIELLKTAGALLEVRDNAERTPLYIAVEEGHTSAAIKLIELGSNVNIEDIDGTTPLCVAVWQQAEGIVSALLSAGARIPPDQYLLHHAVLQKKIEIVKLLVTYGSSINLRDNNGDTPLLLAARYGLPQIAKILLQYGASVDYPNSLTGSTALHEAVGWSDNYPYFEELFMCLLSYNVNLNAICFSSGYTALFRAIHLKRDKEARLLIKHGADVNLCSLDHCMMDNISLAIARQSMSTARLLVLAGAKPPKEWKYNPRSLTDIVRLVIRKNLKFVPIYTAIERLPLPKLMKSFLMFENDDIED